MKGFMIVFLGVFLIASTTHAQWIQQSAPTSAILIGVAFASPSNGWAVGEGGVMLHTTNKGETWSQYASPSGSNLNKIAFTDSLNGYIVGDNNALLATADGGSTWRFLYPSGTFSSAHYYGIRISPTERRAWIVGGVQSSDRSAVVRMNLGYAAEQYHEFTGRCVGVDFVDDQVGWVSGMNRLLMKTTNGGDSWTQLDGDPDGGYSGLNRIRFFNADVGLAVGDSGAIVKTVDGGSHWYSVRKKDEILFSVALHGDSVAWVVGSDNAVVVSADQGETWQQQSTPVSASVTFEDLFFLDAHEGWIVGSGGTILHTVNGGVTAVLERAEAFPGAFALKANYPNPFNPSTTLEYEIAQASYISMKIYDMAGREVETLYEGPREPGKYAQVWNADRFASGVYYCRLSASGGSVRQSGELKVMLIR